VTPQQTSSFLALLTSQWILAGTQFMPHVRVDDQHSYVGITERHQLTGQRPAMYVNERLV